MKRTDKEFFTPEEENLIRQQLADSGAPEFEIERFILTCITTGLSPLGRQIYGNVQRKRVKKPGTRDQFDWVPTLVIITSIDGFRAIAERSGEYRGQTPPNWYYTNHEGKTDWHDVCVPVRDKGGNPINNVPEVCRIGVYRHGFDHPVFGVANFDSFAQYQKDGDAWGLNQFWKKMPEHMIAKVAEAQAIRKAFPLLASGLYVEEEVGRDEDEETPPARVTEASPLPPGAEYVKGHEPKASPKPEKPAPAISTPKEPQKAVATPPEANKEPVSEPAPVDDDQIPGAEVPPMAEESPFTPGSWQDYPIQFISIKQYAGRKLGEMDPSEIEAIFAGWVVRHAEKIKLNPGKVKEAEMITVAYEATKTTT